jgi:MFS family permease
VFVVIGQQLVDARGRRPMLLSSIVAVTACLITLAFCLGELAGGGVDAGVTLFALCAFMASFSLGMGPVTWVVVSEIFPLEHRAKGTAVSMAVNRLTSGTVAMTFLSLSDFVGVGGAFLFFSGVSATHFAFTFRYLPETKGKSLEEIEASVGSGASGGGAYARLDEADER